MTGNGGLRIGIFVFDGAQELDVVGPFEVLATWAEHSALRPTVDTFSWDGGGVRFAKGLRIVPARSADDVGPLHLLLYPGGVGVRTLLTEPRHLAWLRAVRKQTPIMGSICTGALAFAAAGLLAGRPATTHRDYYDELAEIDASILVDTEARYVDDGDVLTSAGVSAGIDMALHLIAHMESPEVAATVAHDLQYRA